MSKNKRVISGLLSLIILLSMTFFATSRNVFSSDEVIETAAEEHAAEELNTEKVAIEEVSAVPGSEKETKEYNSASATQPAAAPAALLSEDLSDVADASYTYKTGERTSSADVAALQPGVIAKVADIPLDRIHAVYYTINPGEQPSVSGENEYGSAIITNAQKYLGVPYVGASADPSVGFDCSGFVNYVYNQTGIFVHSRSCSGIWTEAQKVNVPTPGDIVFFVDPETRSRFTHVGIYLGDNKMIHAGTSGICYTDLGISYWQPRIYGYGRIVPAAEETAGQE